MKALKKVDLINKNPKKKDTKNEKHKLANLLSLYYHLKKRNTIIREFSSQVDLKVLLFQIYFYPKVKKIISHLYCWNLKKRLIKTTKSSSALAIIQSYFRAFKFNQPNSLKPPTKPEKQQQSRTQRPAKRKALRVPKQPSLQTEEHIQQPPRKRPRKRLLGEDGQLTKLTLQHTELNSVYHSISEVKFQSISPSLAPTSSTKNTFSPLPKRNSHFSKSGSHPSNHKWTHTNIDVARRDCQTKWKEDLKISMAAKPSTLTWSPVLFFPEQEQEEEQQNLILDTLIIPEIPPPPLPSPSSLKGILRRTEKTNEKQINLPEKKILFIRKHGNHLSNHNNYNNEQYATISH